MGFGGAVLGFAFRLPEQVDLANMWTCQTCLIAKSLGFIFTVASIWMSATELGSTLTNGMVDPKKLMQEKLFCAEQGKGKAFVVNTLVETISDIQPQLLHKGKRLNQVIILLVLAVTALAIDGLIASIFA